MNKTYRWDEVWFNGAKVTDRERMKRRAAAKICTQRDTLAERASFCAKNFAFGGLLSVAWAAGKSSDWFSPRVAKLYDNEDARLFDVFRRIDASYVKFLPQRVGACRG